MKGTPLCVILIENANLTVFDQIVDTIYASIGAVLTLSGSAVRSELIEAEGPEIPKAIQTISSLLEKVQNLIYPLKTDRSFQVPQKEIEEAEEVRKSR